ncbi:hypothetical protein BpHYR1_005785 [Brachionus plicatilis]|uniref:SEA domain-containing protein n=1 Tax=Brachionus plicatilis TaxID=10195 RepID=A0A3M7QE89_BRAPC|nr:hypothetical protein BpHYR1_005785 [Brachionus plicatilis]
MIIKYDNGVIDLYNGYNRDYVSPTRENASLSLLQEVRINDKVALVVQRSVAFVSTVNPSVNNDLRNCYRLAIASGPLLNQFTLPHSQIPQFTPNCLVIASDKTTSGPLVPYYVNMSIDNQFTDDLLDPNSANYFRTRLRIEKFITDSLQVDNLFAKNFQLLSLSPGSVISISGISLENAGLEKQITDTLVKGNTDFLPVMKDRIFVTSSLDDSSTPTATTTTTITTVNMTITDTTTTSITFFANTTTTLVNETTNSTNTTTFMTNETTNAIDKTMETEVATSAANVTIELDFFAVEFKVDMTYSENLKNTSSTEYNSFVTLLDNFIKSGFLTNGQIDALKKWNVEDLRQGSIVALTSMSVAIAENEDKVGFVKKNLESGNKEILPVESIEIRSFDATTKQTTPSTTIETTSTIGKKDDDSRSVSAVAIVVPIVCVVFIIIIIIIGICYFRQRRKARNSYILQTRDRNGGFDAASRASEIPRNPPRFSSEDELSRHSQANLSARFKSANESPPNIDSLGNQDKRDSGPPTYSMTDKASDQFKDIPLGSNDKNEKIQMNEINLNEKDRTVLNYDTSDIDDTRPNLGTIIKSSNNPLFQMDE